MHMLRAALFSHLLLTTLVAGGCSRTPSVRVEARRLDGPRPPQVSLRCRATGLKPPVKYQWRFPAGVRQIGWGVPQDEPTELVEPPASGVAWAECAATGDDKKTVRATHSLAPLAVSAAPARAKVGELVTVRGSGFGPSPNEGDGIWLVPRFGAARAADVACKGASWSEVALSACVPPSARGASWQLRVQAAGELAVAAQPLVVAP
ncbi:MAG: hypothetical protein ACXVDD_14785 [Polyangia bacterium]